MSRPVETLDEARAMRLVLALPQDDRDAYSIVLGEIGDCTDCLRTVLWFQTRAVVGLVKRGLSVSAVTEELEDILADALDRLEAVAAELNKRPRKRYDFDSPAQVLNRLLAQPPQVTVASEP